MLETAFILSVLTFLAGWFLLVKMPQSIRRLVVGQMLLSDITATAFVYICFGGGPYALLGAGFTCLWISLGLIIGKKYCEYSKVKWRMTSFLALPFPVPYLEQHEAELPPTWWYIRVSRVVKWFSVVIFGRKERSC